MAVALSIIIVNYNERDFLADALSHLAAEFSDVAHEVIVVDNASRDGSADMVRQQFPKVRLVASPKNLFYGQGNNLGLAEAKGEWLMILNPDVRWEPGKLRPLLTAAQNAGTGTLVAPLVLNRDGSVQLTAHRRFPNVVSVFIDYCLPLQQVLLRLPWHPYLLRSGEHHQAKHIAHATGICLLFHRHVYDRVGGLDPEFSMYMEETEWQKRMAEAHISRQLVPAAQLTHFGSAQKSFAQASPHFLWGLRYYARKHWSSATKFWLLPTVWVAALISDVFLLILWFPSWLLGRGGQRLRHYTRQYSRLTARLLTWPNRSPLQ